MKTSRLSIAIVLLVFATTVGLAEKYSTKGFKMTVAGTSTLHDWEVPASKLNSTGDMSITSGELQAISSFWVEVESKSLHSGKESMDDKMYDALKADDFQKITFQLGKIKSMTKNGSDWNVVANGNMNIAGVTQNMDLNVTVKVLQNGDVEVSGSKKLKMTSFKMDPPTAMLGVIKSGDEVTISFTVTMKKG